MNLLLGAMLTPAAKVVEQSFLESWGPIILTVALIVVATLLLTFLRNHSK